MADAQAIVGRLREFSLKNDWAIFKPRLENFFLANAITDVVRKQAVLLNSFDEEAYRLAVGLSVPVKPEMKTYDQLITLFDKHFLTKESTFAARFRFYNATRDSKESVKEWLVRLRSLAGNCNFGATINENVLDKFVIGFGQGNVRDRLFEEDATKLTIERAVEIATAREAAFLQYHLDTPDIKIKKEPMYFLSKKGNQNKGAMPKKFFPRQGDNKVGCNVCGWNNNETVNCKFRTYTCSKCSKKGHLAKMCWKGDDKKTPNKLNAYSKKSKKIHFMADEKPDSDFEENLFHLKGGSEKGGASYTTVVNIEGKDIVMEVDTGCKRTVIPNGVFKENFPHLVLNKTMLTFVSYFANKEKPLGVTTCSVVHNGKLYKNMEFFVSESPGPPLLGRVWFETMGYRIVNINETGEIVRPIHFMGDTSKDLLEKLCSQFPEVFTDKLGKFNKNQIKLDLMPNAEPRFMKSRPVPYALVDKVNTEIDRLVQEGILESVNFSPYASPIVPILKKNGIRIAGDYKLTLNPFLKVDQYPLPRVQDLFQRVQGCSVFAKLDLSHAYLQLELEEESRSLVTINTPKGLFRYTRVPYGVACAPAKFQKIIDALIEGLDGTCALLDDILIGGKDLQQLMQRLLKVIERLKEVGLTLRVSKCEIGKESLEYLGFRIDKDGLHSTDDKVRAILQAPSPQNVKELQSCLGLINFLAKFLPSMSSLLGPLYNLLRKDTPWSWSKECEEAYTAVKQVVKENRSLAHFDPELPIKLTVDGSDFGLGAVISQKHLNGVEKPIAFASRTLTQAERGYSQLHKEGAGLIFGLKKFHVYLYGRKWILANDNRPLLAIFGPKKGIPQCAASRLQRWALMLANYSYDVEWVKSGHNIADWLSRAPLTHDVENKEDLDLTFNYVMEDNVDLPIDYKMILAASKKDSLLTKVGLYLQMGWPEIKEGNLLPFFKKREELHVERDILMWGYRVVVPFDLRVEILKELHASHMGVSKVKALARSYVWWPNIDADIEKTVLACRACNVNKDNPPKTSLVPWEWPQRPWQRIHIDYLGPLQGKYYLVVVDSHSKWLEAFKTGSMTSEITIQLLRSLFARFGLPEVLVSDNYSAFTADIFQNFLRKNGIKFKSGAPFSPRTNGAAENSVRTIKRSLKIAISDAPLEELDQSLQRFLLDYRNTPHMTTGVSPAKALLGRQLRTRLDLMRPPTMVDHVQRKQLKQMEDVGGVEIESKKISVEDQVWVRNYRKGEEKWVKAVVKRMLGPRRVEVWVSQLNRNWTRHLDQVRKGEFEPERQIEIEPDLKTLQFAQNLMDNSKVLGEDDVTETVQTTEKEESQESCVPVKEMDSLRPQRVKKKVERYIEKC